MIEIDGFQWRLNTLYILCSKNLVDLKIENSAEQNFGHEFPVFVKWPFSTNVRIEKISNEFDIQ